MSEYYAHVSNDGRMQTVSEHLKGTAGYAALFASAFGCREQGRLLGLAHDIGKCSPEYQAYLKGGPEPDHVSAGMLECAKLECTWAAACVAGHRSALPDFGDLKTDTIDSDTLYGRIKFAGRRLAIPGYDCPVRLTRIQNPDGFAQGKLAQAFLIRLLYSCLLDADFADREDFRLNKKRRSETPDRLFRIFGSFYGKYASCDISSAVKLQAGSDERGLWTFAAPEGEERLRLALLFALKGAVRRNMQQIFVAVPKKKLTLTAAALREACGADVVAEGWDGPICVLSTQELFEAFYGGSAERSQKLHCLAGSMLILENADELPVPLLRPFVTALKQTVTLACSGVLLLAEEELERPAFEPFDEEKEDPLDTLEIVQAFEKGLNGCELPFKQIGALLTEEKLLYSHIWN